MARIPAFQAGRVGSIPITRSKIKSTNLYGWCFYFSVCYLMGIEQGAITNSLVDCLCDAATSVSETIGAGAPRQIPITRSKIKALTFMVGAFCI